MKEPTLYITEIGVNRKTCKIAKRIVLSGVEDL